MQQFVGSINEHARQEHTILVAQANQQYRKSQVSTLWNAMGTGERDEYDATHLIEPPAPQPFKLPEVFSGFLLLRRLNLDRRGRAELLRASGGLNLSKLEHVLRTSEAEHFSRVTDRHRRTYYAEDDEENAWSSDYDTAYHINADEYAEDDPDQDYVSGGGRPRNGA